MKLQDALEPKIVWKYFDEILQVPRPSKKEEKIIQYLLDFGKQHQLETLKDDIGNVLIRKPATAGNENKKGVILQSHIDMVCEKNSDVEHNFDTDPIQAYIDGEWVKAKGTTLGADDGIGMAAQMAVLASDDVEHGPLECLFTVDEETGLTGAFELQENFLKGEILLNLDSEDEGELFIGCAGGRDTTATFNYLQEKLPETDMQAFKINVSGLKGGHSGDDIHKGLGNSNKIMNRLLWYAAINYDLRLHYFNGGNLRNAIAREAEAVVVIPANKMNAFSEYFDAFVTAIRNEYAITEPELKIVIDNVSLPDTIIDIKTQYNLLNALYACPHGVYAMSRQIPDLVETSTNLASVKFIDDNRIFITTSQRSSVDSAKEDIVNTVKSVFCLAGAKVEHSDGYPGWSPNTNSEILNITEKAYLKLFNEQPVVRAIHAGLECGLFLTKYPHLDMISFGPTIKGAHSPDERLNIDTNKRFWALLLDVLKAIPEKE